MFRKNNLYNGYLEKIGINQVEDLLIFQKSYG